MRTHVALLRGINVSARNRMKMSDLRAVAASLGLTDVVTYIQSGNLVFTSPGSEATKLAGDLEDRIREHSLGRPDVVVLTREAFTRVVADNPYPDEPDPKCLHVVFHRSAVGPDAVEAVAAAEQRARAKGSRDAGTVIGDHIYLHTPDGLGRSVLAAELNRRQASTGPAPVSTMRNWATVTKVLALLDN